MPMTVDEKESIITRLLYQIIRADGEVPELIKALRKVVSNIEEEHNRKQSKPVLAGKADLEPYVPVAARPGFFG